MKYYFCLVPAADAKNGSNIGRTYAYKNRSKWVECTDISTYLTTGYVKGVDYVVYEDKAYMLLKTYLDLKEKFAVVVASESVFGSDV